MPVSAAGERTLERLLDELAARTPSPGGGAAAGWTAAMAAALVEMAASFTLARDAFAERHPRMEAIRGRAAELRSRVMELTEQELDAYGPVLEALRLAADDPRREPALRAAQCSAADPPLAIAHAATELAELGAEVARDGNAHLKGDSVAAAVLAEAACQAASRLVEINLAQLTGDRRGLEAVELTRRALAARRRALS